jgi:hypothetical protein
MASELAEHVNKMVNEIFDGFTVVLVIEDDISYYSISYDENTCLRFRFSSDFSILYIDRLSTCGDAASGRNGKSLMGLIDRLAASIPNLKYMKLKDASGFIFCGENIELAYLKILTSENADSWYGSLGYKAPTDVPDKIHNKRIRNMTVDEALSDRDRVGQSEHDGFKHQSNKLFPNLDTSKMLVKKYVNEIFNSIHEFKENHYRCTAHEMEKAEFVSSAIKTIGKLLNYYDSSTDAPRLKKPNVSISSGIPGSVSSGIIAGKPYAIMIPAGTGAGFGGRGTKRKCRASRKHASRKYGNSRCKNRRLKCKKV